jgi:hypothetical protein
MKVKLIYSESVNETVSIVILSRLSLNGLLRTLRRVKGCRIEKRISYFANLHNIEVSPIYFHYKQSAFEITSVMCDFLIETNYSNATDAREFSIILKNTPIKLIDYII